MRARECRNSEYRTFLHILNTSLYICIYTIGKIIFVYYTTHCPYARREEEVTRP